jgi:hypothetical protein
VYQKPFNCLGVLCLQIASSDILWIICKQYPSVHNAFPNVQFGTFFTATMCTMQNGKRVDIQVDSNYYL